MKITTPQCDNDFRAMWKLNYAVFASELGQYEENKERILVDKFFDKSIYKIAIDEKSNCVVGMIAAHWQAPYSAVQRFGVDLEKQLPPGKTAEIRLFAFLPEYRKTNIPIRLAAAMFGELFERGLQKVVISGISDQRVLYMHMGFEQAGPPIGDGEALFYPMLGDIPKILSENIVFKRYLL